MFGRDSLHDIPGISVKERKQMCITNRYKPLYNDEVQPVFH